MDEVALEESTEEVAAEKKVEKKEEVNKSIDEDGINILIDEINNPSKTKELDAGEKTNDGEKETEMEVPEVEMMDKSSSILPVKKELKSKSAILDSLVIPPAQQSKRQRCQGAALQELLQNPWLPKAKQPTK